VSQAKVHQGFFPKLVKADQDKPTFANRGVHFSSLYRGLLYLSNTELRCSNTTYEYSANCYWMGRNYFRKM